MSDRSEYIDQEVGRLLGQYQEYKQLLVDRQALSSSLAKQKLQGEAAQEDEDQYVRLGNQLQTLSESMVFASPSIWMRYKNEAYADESQPILTLHDFRMHCSKPGYICTKRFLFLNAQLKQQNLPVLNDARTMDDGTLLADLVASDVFATLENQEGFMDRWGAYEYNKVDGRVAKWENFKLDEKMELV